MGNTFYFEWEVQLMEWLQTTLPDWAISFISFFTIFGEELVLIVILGTIYWAYNKEIGKKMGLFIVLANVLNPMIKNVALRRRPYMDNPGIQCLKKVDASGDAMDVVTQGYSFPSGHSTNAAVAYGSLAYFFKKKVLSIAAGVLILLVALSRVVLGVHYPTDVIVGIACGLFVLFLVPLLQSKIQNKKVLYLILALVCLPGFFYCQTTDFYTGYGMMIGFFFADLIEEKIVKFENTKSIPRGIARVLVGGALYLLINKLLKMPFSADFLASATTASFLVRTVRYMIIIVLLIGIYPLCFAPVDAWLDKRKS